MKSTHRQQARGKRRLVTTHGLLDTLFARPDAPMPRSPHHHCRNRQLHRPATSQHCLIGALHADAALAGRIKNAQAVHQHQTSSL